MQLFLAGSFAFRYQDAAQSVALIRRVIRRRLVRSVLVHHQFLVTGWQFCSCQEMFLRTASSWSQAGSSDVIQMHDLMQFTGMC